MPALPLYSGGSGGSTSPQIPIYENADTNITPGSVDTQAATQAGRRLGGEYRQQGIALASGIDALGRPVAQALEERDRLIGAQELADKGFQYAQATAAQFDAYGKEIAGVQDFSQIPAIQGRYLDELKQSGSDFLSKINSPLAKEHFAEHLEAHQEEWMRQMRADTSVFLSNNIKAKAQGLVNENAKLAAQNPNQLGFAISSTERFLKGIYDTIPNGGDARVQAARDELVQQAKEHIATNGIEGAIERGENPKALLDKFSQYVKNPAALLEKYDNHTRAQLTDQLRIKELDRMNRQEAEQNTLKEGFAKGTPVAGGINYPADFSVWLEQNKDHLGAAGYHMLQEAQSHSLLGIKSTNQQGNADAFMQRIMDPEHQQVPTQAEIDQATAKQDISPQQRTDVMNALAMPEGTKKDISDAQEYIENVFGPKAIAADGKTSAFDAGALLRAKQALSKSVREAISRGQDIREVLDPRSPLSPLKDLQSFKTTDQSNDQAVIGASAAHTEDRATIMHAVQLMNGLAQLRDHGDFESINALLKSDPMAVEAKIDARDDRWCAAALNATLGKLGIPGTGSEQAKSFLNWGVALPSSRAAEQGDVYYTPPSEGSTATGHVGMVTDTRMGARGLELKLASSSGLKWMAASSLPSGFQLRRYVAPIDAGYKSEGFSIKKLWEGISQTQSRAQTNGASAW